MATVKDLAGVLIFSIVGRWISAGLAFLNPMTGVFVSIVMDVIVDVMVFLLLLGIIAGSDTCDEDIKDIAKDMHDLHDAVKCAWCGAPKNPTDIRCSSCGEYFKK